MFPVLVRNKCLLFRQLSETRHTDCADLLIIKASASAPARKEKFLVPFKFELWSWRNITLIISVSAKTYFTSIIFHRISKCDLNQREVVFY